MFPYSSWSKTIIIDTQESNILKWKGNIKWFSDDILPLRKT